MSQQSQSKISNENESKTIENVPLSLHNINNLINSSEGNSTPKNNKGYNALNYNFLENNSGSNNKNKKLEINDKFTPILNYSNILKNADLSIDSFIILLYKELFSSNKFYNNDNYFKNSQKKLANLLNNERNNPNIFGDILKIFNESIKRIVDIKLKDINDQLNQYQSKLLLLEQNDRYLIKKNFLKQTKIDILENEIDSYIEMEEEFEEMKEKLKYENGKFLHNEKKENEILILRAENSNLKKIIDKNERTIEEKELIIKTIKKKSSSMINTNNNTIKNSFELNEGENVPSPLMLQPQNQNQMHNQNNSNIASYKSYNNIHKFKSPRNDLNSKAQKSNNKKLSNVENNAYQNSKKNIMSSRVSTKELIIKRIKNKVLNMKKIRRINNDSCLEHYNKSSSHITNSLICNNSNSSKRIKKNLNSYFKNIKNNIFNGVGKINKKLNSGLTNGNLSNLIKNNNKITVNSISENNMNSINNNLYNNNSFLFKTTRKKFTGAKKNLKTNTKHTKDEFVIIRNNNSLIKSPNTFNNNDFENSVAAMKNNNIIINNIIQNSSSLPVSGATSKSKEKGSISEIESNRAKNNNNPNFKQYTSSHMYKKDKNIKPKSSGILSVNIKKKID